jgi:cytochrome c peroxidase
MTNKIPALLIALACLFLLASCGGSSSETSSSSASNSNSAPASASATTLSIADALFHEKALSASGQLACSGCHTDETAHSTAANVALPLGGISMNQQVFRASPSILYKAATPAFSFDDDGNAVGGFDWDGRVNTLAAQASGPLLAVNEMANASVADVASKVRRLSYFGDFAAVFNLPANASDQQVFDTLLTALQTYQQIDPDYLLFNSKFDRFLDGTATLSAQEARGLATFNDPNKGNCASCHTSQVGPGGARPVFTNFKYAALGLPRNANIVANADSSFYDMGLCGPVRTDLSSRTNLCGQFKIPTLRNIALTAPYFHNSSITTLSDAVGFYATRDINPTRWYPTVNGAVQKFNDLPAALRGNVIQTRPFGLANGATPIINAQDVADITAFLLTLTDDPDAPPGKPTVGR